MTSRRPVLVLLRLAAPLVALGVVLPAVPAGAQDVELLGRIHGTRPPDSYYRVMRADPRAFRFDEVWERRVPAVRELRRGLRDGSGGDAQEGGPRIQRSPSTGFSAAGNPAGGGAPALGGSGSGSTSSTGLGERAAVTGEFAVPMVLGLFDDTGAAPFPRERMHEEFWIGPNTRGMTIPDFYTEISGGQLDMVGATFDWVRTGLTQGEVTGNESGVGFDSRTGEFIVEILEGIEARQSVDWGRLDNDGPDGIPNTVDDDGYVDVLTVVHPTAGAECDQDRDRIWSHKWTLEGAYGSAYETDTPSASGGNIRINSYTIQPAYSCDETRINEIGVFAHELGHGFGLPDLYGVGAHHAGIGNWGLMGTGSWGCDGGSPERPCHMSAWSKAMLGWVDVVDVPGGSDAGTLLLDPVESSRTVYRAVAGSGADEYFLLENRQRIGSDADLFAPGLLVWHVDDEVLRSWWSSNQVNSDPDRMGVWLRQADGLNDLAESGGGRGDPGDPFPGSTGNTAYHVSTVPSSRDHAGASTGITVTEITESGDRVGLELSTRYRILTFRTEGTSGSEGMVTVDGTTSSGDAVTSSPFQVHEVAAAPGYEVSPGTRIGFLAWSDGGERVHEITTGWADSTLTASYAGTEHLLDLSTDGPVWDVAPGTFELTPSSADHWFDEGVEVVVDARARTGFRFTGWSGDWSGDLNPTTVVMDAPGAATAHFEQAFEVAGSLAVAFEAGVAQEIVLEATDGNEPVVWELVEGALPEGMSLVPEGVLRGAALEVGTFTVTLRAMDALGLQAVSPPVELEATTPVIGTDALASGFFLEPQVLTTDQRNFLDRQGNRNGLYDLGDFRAFVLANPDLPASADIATPAPVTVRLEMGLTADPGPPRDGTPKREEEQ